MSERDPFDRQHEEALELVRIAQMCMNPQLNANWFVRARNLLNETDSQPQEQVGSTIA